MARNDNDPGFTDDEILNSDPLGEQAFEETGFADAPGGRPDFDAGGLEDNAVLRRPGQGGQKVAGVPDADQHRLNTPSLDRPDSEDVVIRERGGESKGDPAVGGTRPG
jgi:hypothetical protein